MSDFLRTQYKTLFDYTFYTSRILLESAHRISDTDYRANPGYGRGSIHSILLHMINAQHSWRIGLETGQRPQQPKAEDYPTLQTVEAWSQAESQAWQATLDRLTPDEFEGEMDVTNVNGVTRTIYRWRIFQHVLLHSMQHHSEVAQLLTSYSQSPGDIDFIFFKG